MRAANRIEENETPDAAWQDAYGTLVEGAIDTMRAGQRVLVVGGPAGTFDQKLMRNPRLLFWPTVAARHDDQTRALPTDVGMALVCTLVSARLQMHVRSQVRERSLKSQHPSVLSPGTITRVLRNALGLLMDEERAALVAQTKPLATKAKPVAAPEPAPELDPEPEPEPDVEPALVETSPFLSAIDDAIASLQLVREQAAVLEARAMAFNGINPDVLAKFHAFRRALRES
jgi:hypothetical protein